MVPHGRSRWRVSLASQPATVEVDQRKRKRLCIKLGYGGLVCYPPRRDYGEKGTGCLRLDSKPVFILFVTPFEVSSSKNIPFRLARKETEGKWLSWPSLVIAISDIYMFLGQRRQLYRELGGTHAFRARSRYEGTRSRNHTVGCCLDFNPRLE